MVLILCIMAYHRTAYTIGFMGWYDTFQNTKINYFLFSLGLAVGPLIYLYVRTTLKPPFSFYKTDLYHFIPVLMFIAYRLVLLILDSRELDWQEGYEGRWQREIHLNFLAPIFQLLEYSSKLIYYAFTIQLYLSYRHKIHQYFSSTHQVELNWIRNFLAIYTFLFIYGYMTDVVDAFVFDLDYIHNWWVHFFSAIAIVYLGVKAYYTDLRHLHDQTINLDLAITPSEKSIKPIYSERIMQLDELVKQKKLYLNSDLTLKDLASEVNMSIHDLSELINKGAGINFNEWVNRHRVEEVKQRLLDPEFAHLSLVSIGYDCGFNSKATFNRVFKNLSGMSPSQFKASSGI